MGVRGEGGDVYAEDAGAEGEEGGCGCQADAGRGPGYEDDTCGVRKVSFCVRFRLRGEGGAGRGRERKGRADHGLKIIHHRCRFYSSGSIQSIFEKIS